MQQIRDRYGPRDPTGGPYQAKLTQVALLLTPVLAVAGALGTGVVLAVLDVLGRDARGLVHIAAVSLLASGMAVVVSWSTLFIGGTLVAWRHARGQSSGRAAELVAVAALLTAFPFGIVGNLAPVHVAVITVLGFAVLVLLMLREKRAYGDVDRAYEKALGHDRQKAIAEGQAATLRLWAEEAEGNPELSAMLAAQGWSPNDPPEEAKARYLTVWEQYRASRRARGLPIWASVDPLSKDEHDNRS